MNWRSESVPMYSMWCIFMFHLCICIQCQYERGSRGTQFPGGGRRGRSPLQRKINFETNHCLCFYIAFSKWFAYLYLCTRCVKQKGTCLETLLSVSTCLKTFLSVRRIQYRLSRLSTIPTLSVTTRNTYSIQQRRHWCCKIEFLNICFVVTNTMSNCVFAQKHKYAIFEEWVGGKS